MLKEEGERKEGNKGKETLNLKTHGALFAHKKKHFFIIRIPTLSLNVTSSVNPWSYKPRVHISPHHELHSKLYWLF